MKNQRVLKQSDAVILNHLADQLLRNGETQLHAGEELLDMISTAKILPPNTSRIAYVSLDSLVSYVSAQTGCSITVTIVRPHQADLQRSQVSVLSPVGFA